MTKIIYLKEKESKTKNGDLRNTTVNNFRRKAEFAVERRNLLRTGEGQTPNSSIESDPELDSCGIDIEIPDTIDCDTVPLIQSSSAGSVSQYSLVDDVLVHQVEGKLNYCNKHIKIY